MKKSTNTLILVNLMLLAVLGIIHVIQNYVKIIDANSGTIENVKNVLIVIGGIFASFIALWRANTADKNYKNDTKRLKDQEKAFIHEKEKFKQQQINERYAKAVELLGNKAISVRIGAMYTLEKLAYEDEFYAPTLIDILTAYIKSELQSDRLRESSDKWQNELDKWENRNKRELSDLVYDDCFKTKPYRTIPEDIKTALIILSNKETKLVDLRNTDWKGFDFGDTAIKEFNSFSFKNACLCHTKFSANQCFHKCVLTGIDFSYSHLKVVEFKNVYRDENNNYNSLKANFTGAYLDFIHVTTPISQCIFDHTVFRAGHIVMDTANSLVSPASNLIFRNCIIGNVVFNRQLENVYFEQTVFDSTQLMFNEKPLRFVFFNIIAAMNGSNIFEKINDLNLPKDISEIKKINKNIILVDRKTYDALSKLSDFNTGFQIINQSSNRLITTWPSGFRDFVEEIEKTPPNYYGLLTSLVAEPKEKQKQMVNVE